MIDDSKDAKRRRALNLFIESVIKPDHELRGDAHGKSAIMNWWRYEKKFYRTLENGNKYYLTI